jgi:hypothetical protein
MGSTETFLAVWCSINCTQSDLCGFILRWPDGGHSMVCFLRLSAGVRFALMPFGQDKHTEREVQVLSIIRLLTRSPVTLMSTVSLGSTPVPWLFCHARSGDACIWCLWRMAKAAKICANGFARRQYVFAYVTYVGFFASTDSRLYISKWAGPARARPGLTRSVPGLACGTGMGPARLICSSVTTRLGD